MTTGSWYSMTTDFIRCSSVLVPGSIDKELVCTIMLHLKTDNCEIMIRSEVETYVIISEL